MKENFIKGRGAQINTPNRFSQTNFSEEHPEGIDEPLQPNPHRKLFYDHPKEIISKSDSPDLRNMHSINPYHGCEHGCIYCYARNSHEYWGFSAGLDFESKIVAKPDAPKLLEQQFQKRSWRPAVIVLSGNTDCYQPIERELKITQKLLQIFLKYGNPVSIITKNTLIERDLHLLKALAAERLVHVWFSINSLNESLRSKMEPRTASSKKRIAVMEKLTSAGIPCGVMIAPVIPGLNDHEIPQVMERIAEAGALSAGYTIVRLNGAIGSLFQDWLLKTFPERADKVSNQIKSIHGGKLNDSQWGRRVRGEGQFAENIRQLFQIAKAKYLHGKEMPPYDLSRFRRNGTYQLF